MGWLLDRIVKGVEKEEYIIISGREDCPELILEIQKRPG